MRTLSASAPNSPSLISGPAVMAAALLLPGLTSAQVESECDPTKVDCPPNPAFATSQNFNFNMTPSGELWEKTAGYPKYDKDKGAIFTISKQGESTTIQMKYYFFWGRTEMHMKASHGTGIVSSMMWISDNLDEVDWEFLGSKPTTALSNYFGKGNTESADGEEHNVPNVIDDYHNYTTVWTKDRLEWWLDGNLLRTVVPDQAVINGTSFYPQTPMRVRIGIWAGGDPSLPPGVNEWAGGKTNYAEGPFYMYVKSMSVEDYSSGKEYVYSDKSGDWESIKSVSGESKAVEIINRPPPEPEKTISEKFNGLNTTAKIAIIAGGCGFVALVVGAFAFYFFRQRRRGAREAALAAQRMEAERIEIENYKARGINPDGFSDNAPEYGAQTRNTGFMGGNTYSAVPVSPLSPTTEKGFPPAPARSFSNGPPGGRGNEYSNGWR
ncbi:putative extracellular glycosidase [Paramyrothecium foliicola]|nr:putative extracellular glycosidase [Paramyrothecium foliicola]